MNMPGPLPKRVLILGMGWSGRVLAARLQAQGVHVEGTVRDPAKHIRQIGLTEFGTELKGLLLGEIGANR